MRVVREALAGEDDAEAHEWAVHVREENVADESGPVEGGLRDRFEALATGTRRLVRPAPRRLRRGPPDAVAPCRLWTCARVRRPRLPSRRLGYADRISPDRGHRQGVPGTESLMTASDLPPLSPEELAAETGAALPDKEVMSLLDLNADLNIALDAAAPIDLGVAANANAAAPIEASIGANVLSAGSAAAALAHQAAAIDQGITGDSTAHAPQVSSIDQTRRPRRRRRRRRRRPTRRPPPVPGDRAQPVRPARRQPAQRQRQPRRQARPRRADRRRGRRERQRGRPDRRLRGGQRRLDRLRRGRLADQTGVDQPAHHRRRHGDRRPAVDHQPVDGRRR